MGRKLKSNGFIEGTMIAYVAIIITKILGALYVIPFYSVIGETGGVIYACAYSVYNLFLNASTSGIPTAMSIIISEYNTKGLHKTKEKIYKTGIEVVFATSIILFLSMEIFAEKIGIFFMEDMTKGATVQDVALAIRVVALCLLVAPFLSVSRGYLQGHKYIAASSYSQVIEQVVRIFVVLVGSYTAIKLLNLDISAGVSFALSGAAIGAFIALLYLKMKVNQNKKLFLNGSVDEEVALSTKQIIKSILKYSIPVVIVATSTNIYEIVDMKLILTGMNNLGYPDIDTQVIASIFSTWGPKICMIISALSMGMTASLVPNMVNSFVKKDYAEVNRKFNQSVNTILTISLPIAIGIALLSRPVYTMFYGTSNYGWLILKFLAIVSVMSSIKIVMCMSLQSMGKARLVCYCTIIGLLINAGMDLPFIYLFDYLGLPPYLGAAISTFLGISVTISIVIYSLKKSMNFKFLPILRMLLKVIIPNAAMALVIVVMQFILPIPKERNISLVIILSVYALIGGSVYTILAYKSKALSEALGDNFINKILLKLRLNKKV